MRTYIKKLQEKPVDARKRIFIGSLIVCMSFVGLVWANSLGYKLGSQNNLAKTQEDIKPFALFKQTISETVGNITASVGNISLKKVEPKKVEIEKQIDLIPVEIQ